MSKKRKLILNASPTIKIEVKEENLIGEEVLVARGRLQNILKGLTNSDDESASSIEDLRKHKYRTPRKRELDGTRGNFTKVKRRRSTSTPPPTTFHHTYVMKLFDRSVDLAIFAEETPLYPICRAWMANQPRNPQPIIKRRASTPDLSYSDKSDNDKELREINRLPAPLAPPIIRVPSPLPEQINSCKENINLNYDEVVPLLKDQLIKDHIQRWTRVKQKWMNQAHKNETRFEPSYQILLTIYNKAQENME